MIWAKNNGCPWHPRAYYRFIEQGNIDVVEDCLQTHGQHDTDEAFESALQCRDNKISEVIQKLKLLRKYGYSWNENVCATAAANDHMRILQWLKHMGCPWDAKTCEHAVKNGNLKMLKYAHENGCDLSKEAYAYCFNHHHGLDGYFDKIPTNPESSHIEILEYLKENDCPVPNDDEWKLSPNGLAPGSSSWPSVSLDDIWF
ncbi:hypothetical protein CTEN210_06398 [Chaetoceros tenuissimus]|uniref:Ankyrin repeat n=1 Tax=Chaetoceros tenuissimus TaxID=426638 RepID=A0AAD3H450_9STRA|nr:hypothetical protein CTEN210_06398 [Chaetoceros tenuissimus]